MVPLPEAPSLLCEVKSFLVKTVPSRLRLNTIGCFTSSFAEVSTQKCLGWPGAMLRIVSLFGSSTDSEQCDSRHPWDPCWRTRQWCWMAKEDETTLQQKDLGSPEANWFSFSMRLSNVKTYHDLQILRTQMSWHCSEVRSSDCHSWSLCQAKASRTSYVTDRVIRFQVTRFYAHRVSLELQWVENR